MQPEPGESILNPKLASKLGFGFMLLGTAEPNLVYGQVDTYPMEKLIFLPVYTKHEKCPHLPHFSGGFMCDRMLEKVARRGLGV